MCGSASRTSGLGETRWATSSRYDITETERNLSDLSDPRNRRTRLVDVAESTATAGSSYRHPASGGPDSGFSCVDCSAAESRAAARVDLDAGRLETYAANDVWVGGRPFEVSAYTDAAAHVDDYLTLSKPATVTLRGRVKGTATDPDWPLRVRLLFERFGPGHDCDPEVCGSAYEGIDERHFGPSFDETFAVDVSLPAGRVPFNAKVLAQAGAQLSGLNQPAFARQDMIVDNLGGESAVTFEIVVPDDVVVTSGSGRLPILGGASPAPTDTIPPVLSGLTDHPIDATSPAGTVVRYAVSATDDSGDQPTVTCTPASGAVFPIGTTTVACTAADKAGNTAQGTFKVRVAGAAEQLDALLARLTRLSASTRTQLAALFANLPKTRQCDALRAFVGRVDALRRTGRIAAADAADLTARATGSARSSPVPEPL